MLTFKERNHKLKVKITEKKYQSGKTKADIFLAS